MLLPVPTGPTLPMEPAPIIEPTDPWWDDPISPLTRDFLEYVWPGSWMVEAYDEYMRDRTHRDGQYDVKGAPFPSDWTVTYSITGNNAPTVIAFGRCYDSNDQIHRVCWIDCDVLTRGQVVRMAQLSSHNIDCAYMLEYDMRAELKRRGVEGFGMKTFTQIVDAYLEHNE